MPERYYLTRTLDTWPWPRRINAHYNEVQAESQAWIKSTNAFTPEAQEACDRCSFCLLPCLAYPFQEKAHIRIGCDFMNLVFVYDEYSDTSHAVDEVQAMADVMMDALHNPHTPRPKGEWVGGEVTRQFWELAIQTASPQSQKRFIKTYGEYAQSVVQQAADRCHKSIRCSKDYFPVRRDTIGAKPAFALIELDMNLPDEAAEHPVIQELNTLAVDMIVLDNDIFSYNVEQARGNDGHNIITIIMHENKTDVQGATNWVYDYHKKAQARFMDLYENQIPKFGEPVDSELVRYVDGMANWVRANHQWSFESERYFGKRGPEIEKTRWVNLLPKEHPSPDYVGPVIADDSLL